MVTISKVYKGGICVENMRTITRIALAAMFMAAGAGATELSGRNGYEQIQEDGAVVTYYPSRIGIGRNKMRVIKDGKTWIYVDKNMDGDVDIVKRKGNGKRFRVSRLMRNSNVFSRGILKDATDDYEARLIPMRKELASEMGVSL